MARRTLCAVIILVSCKGGDRAPPANRDAAAARAPAPAPAANHFDAIIDGKPTKLRFAKAIAGASGVSANEGLTIILSEHDQTCEAAARSRAPLTIDVAPGPGDSYFVGAPTSTRAFTLRANDGLDGVKPWDVRLALDRFEARAGAHLTGTLDIEAVKPTTVRVHGRLDVEICEEPKPVGLPSTAPDAPISGPWSFGARTGEVVVKSALVFVEPGAEATLQLVELFAAPNVACAAGRETNPRGDVVSTADAYLAFGEVRTSQPPVGVILPARFSLPSADSETLDAHAWIRIDELSVERGELRLAMAARRAGGGGLQIDMAGTVGARICPR